MPFSHLRRFRFYALPTRPQRYCDPASLVLNHFESFQINPGQFKSFQSFQSFQVNLRLLSRFLVYQMFIRFICCFFFVCFVFVCFVVFFCLQTFPTSSASESLLSAGLGRGQVLHLDLGIGLNESGS